MKNAIAFLLAACLVTTACASSGTNAAANEANEAAAGRQPTIVVVDNQALLDMTIYVMRGAQRVRLGTATSMSKTRLKIPQSIVAGAVTLRFIADPIGGSRNSVSEEISLSEGDELGLRIPPG